MIQHPPHNDINKQLQKQGAPLKHLLWKTWNGRVLYQSSTGVRVFDNYFFRTLKFNSQAYQTVLNMFNPQKAALPYIEALTFMAKKEPGNCLLLGLGGAGLAHALSPYLDPFTITALEIDREIIDVAKKFFLIEKIPRLTVIHDDANHFINNTNLIFKHILIDLSDATSFPKNCNHELFFANCHKLLSSDGFLAINLANYDERRPIFNLIKQQFSSSMVAIPLKKCANMVILAAKGNQSAKLLDALKSSRQLQSLTWDGSWGYVAVLTI